MNAAKRVMHLSLLIAGIVVAFCLIGFKLGYNGLLVVGTVAMPQVVTNMLGYLVRMLHAFFVFSYVSRKYNKSFIKPFVVFMFMSLATNELVDYRFGLLGHTLIPMVYFAVVSAYWFKKANDILQMLLRLLVVNVAMIVYQLAAMLIKLSTIHFSSATLSEYEWLLCSVDMSLLLLLFYAIGGVSSCEEHSYARWSGRWKLLVLPEDIESAQVDSVDLEELSKWQQMRGYLRVAAVALLILIQVIQWSVILLVCSIGNVLIEGLILSACFVVFGSVVQRRWHTDSVVKCTLLCSLTFYIAAKAIPSFGYTQLMPVVVGIVLIYASYRASLLSTGGTHGQESKAD